MASTKSKVKTSVKIGAVHASLILLSLIWLVPIIWLALHSLRGESTGNVTYFWPRNFTFANYANLFDSDIFMFGRWFANTIIIAALTALLTSIIVLSTAYVLSRFRFRLRKPYMNMALVLGMFPGFLGLLAINNLLELVDIHPILLLTFVYSSGAGLAFFIAKGYFDTIPKSLDEAAVLDGASKSRVFFTIMLPLSKPIIVYTIIMAFLAPWGDFMIARFLVGGRGNEHNTVALGLFMMISGAAAIGNWFTMFCAGAVLVGVPTSMLFMVMQRYYVSGLTAGAAKG
jgi:arabinogalactan oligomer/maltooligosaccharide transport system permease protein